MTIATEVRQRAATRFDMVGQSLPRDLIQTEEEISAGLATRLVRYAERALDEEGFLAAVTGWAVKVGTDTADMKPSDRNYWVSWTNEKGASLSVVGILTSKGWPTLDHGLQIERS